MVRLNLSGGTGAGASFDPNKGLSVQEFTKQLSSKFENTQLVRILNEPISSGSQTFFQYFESFKSRGATIPQKVAVKLTTKIQERMEATQSNPQSLKEKVAEFGKKLFALQVSESTLREVVNKKEISWIPGQFGSSVLDMIDSVNQGSFLGEFPSDLIQLVQNVITAKEASDKEHGLESSNKAFKETYLNPRGDVFNDLQETVVDDFLGDEMFDLTELEKALPDAPLVPRSSPMSIASVSPAPTQEELVANYQELLKTVYRSVSGEYGEEITQIAYGFADQSGDLISKSSDLLGALKSHAETVKFAQQQLFETYDTELAEYAIAQTQINYTQDLYSQYAASAEQIQSDQDSKIEDLKEWFLEDDSFTVAQREFVFYTPTFWPGYEDKGKFALFNPARNDGPINDYDFYVTDAVWQKMLSMAATVEDITEKNNSKLEGIRAKLGVDHNTMLAASLKIALARYKKAGCPEFQPAKAFKPAELAEIEQQMLAMKIA